jgi:glycine oxidase
MLAPQAEADCADDFFRLQATGRDFYPTFAQALREETFCDIELDQTGTLYLALTDKDEEELERRFAWQTAAGLSVERLTGENARVLEPALSPRVRFALRFPNDWQVENRRLTTALAESLKVYGVRAWADTPAAALHVEGGRIAGVRVLNGYLSTRTVVLAAGAWSSRIPFAEGAGERIAGVAAERLQHPRVEPVRGQMLCFNPRPSIIQLMRNGHVVYTRRGYVVPRRDGRLLAGSTTERVGFDKSVTGAGLQALVEQALEIAPGIADLSLQATWAGLRPCAEDEQPLIGASAEARGLFYATAHYRNGILLAPLTGKLLAEMIVDGRTSPLLDAFTPQRFQHAATVSDGA